LISKEQNKDTRSKYNSRKVCKAKTDWTSKEIDRPERRIYPIKLKEFFEVNATATFNREEDEI